MIRTVVKLFGFKNILFYILFFAILYIEQITIYGIKIGQIWKIPFYLYAIFYIINRLHNASKYLKRFFYVGLLIGIKIIFNMHFGYGLFLDISEAIYVMTLPISVLFFFLKFYYKPEKLNFILLSLSVFFILSNIPFVLGILNKGNNLADSLDKFGLYGEQALAGLFYNISISSKILVVSVLVLIANYGSYTNITKKKLEIFPLIVIGLYFVYLTYTRTGWLMLIIGILVLFLYKQHLGKIVFKVLPFIVLLSYLLFTYVENNEALKLRIRGGTTYRLNNNLNANELSSYRLLIWSQAIENIISEGTPGILLGVGKKTSTEKMGITFGTNFVAHNRFLELFQYGGAITLILYFVFLFVLYKIVSMILFDKEDDISKLPFTLMVIYFISLIPSHGFPVWASLIFGGYIALGLIKTRSSNKSVVVQ